MISILDKMGVSRYERHIINGEPIKQPGIYKIEYTYTKRLDGMVPGKKETGVFRFKTVNKERALDLTVLEINKDSEYYPGSLEVVSCEME